MSSSSVNPASSSSLQLNSIVINSNETTSRNSTFAPTSVNNSGKIQEVSRTIHQYPPQRANSKPRKCSLIKTVAGVLGAVAFFAAGVLLANPVNQILSPSADSSLNSYNPVINASFSSTGLSEGFDFSSTGWDDSLKLSSSGLELPSSSISSSLTSSASISSSSTGSSSSLTDYSSSSSGSFSVISSSTGSTSSVTSKVLGAGARMFMKGVDVGSINFIPIVTNPSDDSPDSFSVLSQLRTFFPTEIPSNGHEFFIVEECPKPGYTRVKAASRPDLPAYSQLGWMRFRYFDQTTYYDTDPVGLISYKKLSLFHNKSIAILEFATTANPEVGEIHESRACGTIVVRSE